MENYFRAVRAESEDGKVSMATMYLSADAKVWWRTKYDDIQNGRCTITTWEDLKRELKTQFLPENVACIAQRQLRELKHTGTIREYVKKFSGLMLDIKDMSKVDKLFTFLEGVFLALLVYVDDIVIATNNVSDLNDFKHTLDIKFKLKDLGPSRSFLGLEIGRSSKGISVSQRPFTLQLLQESGYIGAKTASTPMEPNIKLSKDEGQPISDPTVFRSIIGKLIYITITWLNINYVVNRLIQFLQDPRQQHLYVAHRILQYLKGTLDQGIFFYAKALDPLQLKVFTDANWGSCIDTRRSISKYHAMENATCKVTWLLAMIKDFQIPLKASTVLYCDNSAAIHISENPVFHESTKHMEIDCHIV
ncbi:uncharacterized mitochondrial protein AtMg00810-like [Humulus lupulus]|uniref:uncharacterized mitochondrial protein AtMg00810-like n=1 Tax=Humulus lupulus TaxID=3486 RepID=UPI002B414EEC|nr:uncharacterized mitochondrial protein AtMg00810-like [Humulus lupulus]